MNSRDKGKRGEREFVTFLRDELGEGITRNLDQSRDGGRDVLGVRGFCIEVKRCERFEFGKWITQANAAAVGGEYPVVVWRRNGGDWRCFVEMDRQQLVKFIREEWGDE